MTRPKLSVKEGDELPTLSDTLLSNDDEVIDLTGADFVRFYMQNRETGDLMVNEEATITDAAAGEVEYTFNASQTAVAGRHEAEWVIHYPTGQRRTVPGEGFIEVHIHEPIDRDLDPAEATANITATVVFTDEIRRNTEDKIRVFDPIQLDALHIDGWEWMDVSGEGLTETDDAAAFIEANAADNRVLIFPNGNYTFDTQADISGVKNFGLWAPNGGATFLEGTIPSGERFFEIGTIADPAQNVFIKGFDTDTIDTRFLHVDAEEFLIEDVTFLNERADADINQGYNITVRCPNESGRFTAKNVRMPEGGAFPDDTRDAADAPGGMYVHKDHAGTAFFVDCEVGGFPNNGLYGSSPGLPDGANGRVMVYGGEYRNSNVANIRIGGDGSVIRDSKVVIDTIKPNFAGVRGIYIRNGTGHYVDNVRVEIEVSGVDGIRPVGDSQRVHINEPTIIDNGNSIPLRVSGDDNYPVWITGAVVKGTSNSGTAARIDRNGVTLKDCHFEQPDRTNITLNGTDGKVKDSVLESTGTAIDVNGIGATIQDVDTPGDVVIGATDATVTGDVSISGSADRFVQNGWGTNAGDPRSAGEWLGAGYFGLTVQDTNSGYTYLHNGTDWEPILFENSVTGTELADNAVGSTHISDNSVTGTELADNSVDTSHIIDNAVTSAKIADNNVTTAEIDESITPTWTGQHTHAGGVNYPDDIDAFFGTDNDWSLNFNSATNTFGMTYDPNANTIGPITVFTLPDAFPGRSQFDSSLQLYNRRNGGADTDLLIRPGITGGTATIVFRKANSDLASYIRYDDTEDRLDFESIGAVEPRVMSIIPGDGIPKFPNGMRIDSDISDGTNVVYSFADNWIPQTRLENDSLTVTAGDGVEGGGAVALGGSVTVNASEPFSYDPGMTAFEDALTDEEINRIVLQAGETLEVERIEFRQKGGGSSASADLEVYDVTAAASIGTATLGSTTKDPGSSGTANTVIIRLTNSTGAEIESAPRVIGRIVGA